MKPDMDHSDSRVTNVGEARVETNRALWYLIQLCTHVTKMGDHKAWLGTHRAGGHVPAEVLHVERSGADGSMIFNLGRCDVHATDDGLSLRLEASNEQDLHELQNLIGHRLQAIGSRDHLVVRWQRE